MPVHSHILTKPRLMEKLKTFYDKVQKNDGKIGTALRGIEMNYNNACNLRCKYCFTNSPKGEGVKEMLPTSKIKELADEADELGFVEFDLQGGELLLWPDKIFDVLDAIDPRRFYLYFTTNGYKLDKKTAQKLADHHVSRVSVSIDSFDEKTHDEIRGRKESWKRAMQALKYVQEVGMDPYLNITVGHYNAKSEDLRMLLQYSKDNKYRTLVNVAVPSGMWKDAHKEICDEEDIKHLRNLRKEYKNMNRNLWNPFDRNNEKILGCTTVNRIYITPVGDVLVCPYIHIKIGNVWENSLKEITENGFKIKHFKNHSSLCLAGEDTNFIKKFMTGRKKQSIFHPVDAKDAFTEEDYVK